MVGHHLIQGKDRGKRDGIVETRREARGEDRYRAWGEKGERVKESLLIINGRW